MLGDNVLQIQNQILGGTLYLNNTTVERRDTLIHAYNVLSFYMIKMLNAVKHNMHVTKHNYYTADVEQYTSQTLRNRLDGYQYCVDYVPKGKTVIIPFYEQYCTEDKAASMVLQRSATHTVRVYKWEGKTIIMTTELDTQFIVNSIVLTHLEATKGDEGIKGILKEFQANFIVTSEFLERSLKHSTEDQTAKTIELLNNVLRLDSKAQITNAADTIRSYTRSIEDAERNLQEYYSNLRGIRLRLFALQHEQQDDKTNIINYLIENPHIKVTSITPAGEIRLIMKSPIRNFDKDYFKRFFKRTVDENSKLGKVLKATFIDENYTLYAKAAFLINSSNMTWQALRGVKEPNDMHYYNTHIHEASCTGTFKSVINKAMADRDLIAALNIMMAVTGNLNWPDSVIADRIKEALPNYSENSFENNTTHELLSFNGVVDQLIKEEQTNAPNQNDQNNDGETVEEHDGRADELPLEF